MEKLWGYIQLYIIQQIKKMSSIISDIFYNSKNNALLDHYLNHNLDRSRMSGKLLQNLSKQQEHARKQGYEIEPKFASSMSDVSHSYHQPSTTIALMFRLIIDAGKSEQTFQKHLNYVIKMQIGIASLQQSLAQSKNKLVADLPISIPAQQITKNAAISITLSAHSNRNQTTSLIGCCYLPTENIRNMLQKNLNSKIFTLWLKEIKSASNMANSLSGGKFKVECEVFFDDPSPRRDQSSDSLIRGWKNIPKDQHRKIEEESSINKQFTKRKHEKKPSKPSAREIYDRSMHIQQKSVPSFYQSEMSKPVQVSANQSDNMVLKFQLDNKPTRFIIRQYKPHQPTGQRKEHAYYFVVEPGKEVRYGEEVCIRSSSLDRGGVEVKVMDQDGSIVGVFHLNIMLLMGGCVQGTFPVCTIENGECVGVVKIGTVEDKIQEEIIPKKQIVAEVTDTQQNKTSGCVLSVVKILVMGKEQFHVDSQSQSSPSMIIRYSDTIHRINKDCQIHLDNERPLLEVRLDKPIILFSNSGCLPQQAEIEVYLYGELIGYGRIHLPLSPYSTKRPSNYVVYGSTKQNLTTQNWVCNAIFNYTHFSLTSDYFPQSHIETSLNLVANSSLFQRFGNPQHSVLKNNIQSEMMDTILRQYPKTIHIQAHRIAHLICEAMIRNQCTYLTVINKQQHSMGVEEGDWKRLLEELAFLDEKGEGYVDITDISNIMQYYGITHELCEAGRKGSFLAQQSLYTDQVLYLFLLARLRVLHIKLVPPNLSPQNTEQNKMEQNKPAKTVEIKPQKQQQNNSYSGSQDKQQKLTHVEVIQCTNMHTLLHNSTIPSVRIKLEAHQYTSRVHYSCANPVIRLNKKIKEGEMIVFSHYNVKMEQEIQIGRVRFQQGKRQYTLGGKAVAKLLTIE